METDYVNAIVEYDALIAERVKQAKQEYPNWRDYEITSDGCLFLWSLGAYPSIIKDFCNRIEFSS